MNITIPIDVENCDANTLGEILREYLFTGPGYGCYSSFDVIEQAVAWSTSKIIGWIEQEEPDNDDLYMFIEVTGYSFSMSTDTVAINIDAIWWWDGDGTLIFRVWDGNKVIRFIENTDCKKSDHWRDRD